MNITIILLTICILSLILMQISPRHILDALPDKKTNNELNKINFAESTYYKRNKANETMQYSIMRIVVSIFIATLGIYGVEISKIDSPVFLVLAFVLFILANLTISFGQREGNDVIKFTVFGLALKIVVQILIIIGLSIIINNFTVCVATSFLGFIVGAVVIKFVIKKSNLVHSYYVLVNALKFSNLGLLIIALLYESYAFPILAILGYSAILISSVLYVIDKKEFTYLASILHYLGYIIFALSLNYV